MILLQHAPLRRKLTALTLLCSAVALLTTATALGVYEWVFYRKAMYAELETLTTVTARHTAGTLAFENPEEAQRALAALDEEPTILGAAIYDAKGEKFAEYLRPGVAASVPNLAPRDGRVKSGALLDIAVPLVQGKRYGTLLVRADLSRLGERFVAYAVVLIGTTSISVLIVFVLSGLLSKRIVAPVHALVGAASRVKNEADFSIRVDKTEQDELGQLTDAFNDMLVRIQQHEADLYRGTERLRIAIESAKIGTWDWNLVKDEMLWNDRNYEIFGVIPGTPITAARFFSLVHAEDRARVKTSVEAAAGAPTDFSLEFRLADTARTPRFVALRGLFLKSTRGDPLRAVGVAIDNTERRNAELRIIDSERRFRAVAERAPALIWSCDHALNRDYVNKTWLTFTGRAPEQELGVGWQEGVPGVDLFRWQETVGAAAVQRDPYSIEYRLRRADGALRWIVETGSPRLAADGAFAGYLGSCIDITARKENEAELEAHVRARTRELQAANQELESFSYSVSHDLRGPVRAIQGFAEIALEEIQANNPEIAVERLQRVVRAAERMNKLIDAFISMARVSRAEMRIENVDLSLIAEEVMAFLRSTTPTRRVTVVITPRLECRGDERLLRIAMENLIGNAWKFTAKRDEAQVEFGAVMKDGQRAFFVRDNGAGFDRALAHKLFHAFERLHHNSQFEGLGVGLSTVHRVIEKHNGKIWAEGGEGQGATFYFTVPDRAEPGANAATGVIEAFHHGAA